MDDQSHRAVALNLRSIQGMKRFFQSVLRLSALGVCLSVLATALAGAAPLPRLKVSDNKRFLVTETGQPFFWLGDTAWWIRHLPPLPLEHYLSTRTKQGFNVIQVHCGFSVTNHAGAAAFVNNEPESPNEPFWRDLDHLVARAREHRLYVALVPMWGDEYGRAFGTNATRAFAFGRWIGRRYAAEPHVVWIVSGEYDAINGYKLPIQPAQKQLLIAVAQGLRDAHGGRQLMTIHPGVARSSAVDFHEEPWLAFNMLQSGHLIDSTANGLPENHTLIANAYLRKPIKPVLDGEPIHEDTPNAVWLVKHINGPRAGPDVVRRKAYWAVFSGACGHTYGPSAAQPQPKDRGEINAFVPDLALRRAALKRATSSPTGEVRLGSMPEQLQDNSLEPFPKINSVPVPAGDGKHDPGPRCSPLSPISPRLASSSMITAQFMQLRRNSGPAVVIATTA
jgi:hypothetical protein